MSYLSGLPQAKRSDRFTAVTSRAASTEVMAETTTETTATAEWKANLDFKSIRDNFEAIQKNADNRKAVADVAKVVDLYNQYLDLKFKSDELNQAKNQTAAKMKGKLDADTRAALIEEGKALKEKSTELDAQLNALENALQVEGQKIPNNTHPDVPIGGEENAALRSEVSVARTWPLLEKTINPRRHVAANSDHPISRPAPTLTHHVNLANAQVQLTNMLVTSGASTLEFASTSVKLTHRKRFTCDGEPTASTACPTIHSRPSFPHQVGKQRVFDFPVKDHLQLGDHLKLLNFEDGAIVAGQKFYYLQNAGALLELALVNWTMNKVRTEPLVT
eukprot:2546181-Pyramimonas_sp.AAC.1